MRSSTLVKRPLAIVFIPHLGPFVNCSEPQFFVYRIEANRTYLNCLLEGSRVVMDMKLLALPGAMTAQ